MDLSHLSSDQLVIELMDGGAMPAVVAPIPPRTSSALTHKLNVARELLLRDLQAQMKNRPILSSPSLIHDWLRLYFAKLEHEAFVVLHLNAQNALINVVPLFRGTLTQTAVYPREIVKSALAHNAASVVVCHNHPSGYVEPSTADQQLTRSLKNALSLVDVRVLDHFIVAGDQVLSFVERGLL